MSYICCKRFKGEGLAGHFNIPKGSVLTVNQIGRLCYEDKAVCVSSSELSHEHFAVNDDGQGEERFSLTQAIIRLLSGAKTKANQKKWNTIMEDELCQYYCRDDHEDHWLWSDDFYKAPIRDLDYILKIAKEA